MRLPALLFCRGLKERSYARESLYCLRLSKLEMKPHSLYLCCETIVRVGGYGRGGKGPLEIGCRPRNFLTAMDGLMTRREQPDLASQLFLLSYA